MTQNKRIRSNELFKPGKGWGNAPLGLGNNASNLFDAYAAAFHRSATWLAERFADSEHYNSLDACPLIFLYRHSIELYLKAIVRYGILIAEIENVTPPNPEVLFKHTLLSFFQPIKRSFEVAGWAWDWEIEGFGSANDLESILQQFDAVDIEATAFRFPVNKMNNAAFHPNFTPSIPEFCDLIERLFPALEYASLGLSQEYEGRLEALATSQEALES